VTPTTKSCDKDSASAVNQDSIRDNAIPYIMIFELLWLKQVKKQT